MKRRIFLLFFVALFLIIIRSSAQDALPQGFDNLEDDSVVQGVQKVQDFTEEDKWEYLAQEWKNLLLKNKYISEVDTFLRRFSFVFVFLFGQPYDFSASLFILVYLWLIILLIFFDVFVTYSAFSKGVSYVFAIALNVILAQVGIYRRLSDLVFKTIFYGEGVWRWVSLAVFIISLVFILLFIKIILRKVRMEKKTGAEQEQKLHQKVLKETVQGVDEGLR